jgi:hypothetical protein
MAPTADGLNGHSMPTARGGARWFRRPCCCAEVCEPRHALSASESPRLEPSRNPPIRRPMLLFVADPTPPIVADDRGDILVFPTVVDAESYIEPIDADLGTYVAWDAVGNRLTVASVDSGRAVRIRVDETTPADPDALTARLRWFAGRFNRSDDWVARMDVASLPELLDELLSTTAPRRSKLRTVVASVVGRVAKFKGRGN